MAKGRVRLAFANQLRGLAALSVVLSHFGGVFILMGPTVAWIISTPETHIHSAWMLHITRWNWLNFGALGVAVFFLISGFVIPFSLQEQNRWQFLVTRGFRIFPTFWAALGLEYLIVFGQSSFYGRAMAFGPWIYLYNAILADTALGNGYVDLVNWTLAIEVKFYILMALLRPWILRGRVAPLIGFAVFANIVTIAHTNGILHVTALLADEPRCIGFMMIGTLFHYHLDRLISLPKAVAAFVVMLLLFLICWHDAPAAELFPYITVNYIYALVIFGCAYMARDVFRPMKFLDFFADVSFPLYLIHSIIGFSLLTFMIVKLQLTYGVALPIAFAAVLAVAWLFHKLIERPSIAFGKNLAGGWGQARNSSAALASADRLE